jgi:drug/metabolite transporter (DMT)-like permease
MSGAANVAIAVPAALGAAASFGLGAAVQHRQARLTRPAGRAHGNGTGFARLLARLARQPLWLAGIALTVAGYGLQATALAFGPLTLVAPIVAADLMFALPLAARWARRPLTSRDWLGCLLTAGGIAGSWSPRRSPRAGPTPRLRTGCSRSAPWRSSACW